MIGRQCRSYHRVRHTKLDMTRAFNLNLPENLKGALGAGKNLAYMYEASERVESVGSVDGLRTQLDKLEPALLATDLAD